MHLVNLLLVTMALKLGYGGSCKSYLFDVVDTDDPTLLALPTCTDMNLITMNFSITNHKKAAKSSNPHRPMFDPDLVAKDQVV